MERKDPMSLLSSGIDIYSHYYYHCRCRERILGRLNLLYKSLHPSCEYIKISADIMQGTCYSSTGVRIERIYCTVQSPSKDSSSLARIPPQTISSPLKWNSSSITSAKRI